MHFKSLSLPKKVDVVLSANYFLYFDSSSSYLILQPSFLTFNYLFGGSLIFHYCLKYRLPSAFFRENFINNLFKSSAGKCQWKLIHVMQGAQELVILMLYYLQQLREVSRSYVGPETYFLQAVYQTYVKSQPETLCTIQSYPLLQQFYFG